MTTRREHFTAADIVIGRVLSEDDDLMTIEVVKNEQRPLQLEDGDRFYTLIFTAGKPWETSEGDQPS